MKKYFKLISAIIILSLFCSTLFSCSILIPNDKEGEQVEDYYDESTVYAQALSLGYKGTLEEFIELVSGRDGKDGDNGRDGIDGVGIKSSIIDQRGHLIFVLSDGTTIDAGQLPGSENEERSYTVTFDYGDGITETVYSRNGRIDPPKTPEREGYVFVYWYMNVLFDGGYREIMPWVFGAYAVTSDITLYAYWAPAEIGPDKPSDSNSIYAEGTVLRMATGYNSKQTGLFFDAEIAKDGITLADGNTYNTGDLKPTWVEVENQLGIKFEDHYQGNNATNEYRYWQERLAEVDMVSGTASQLSEAGVAGKVVNIAEYLDYMPNFKAYLEANPIVRLSITGDTSNGAIYFSPYFDGVNDIERMPLMRTDWVEKLLNGAGEFTATESKNLADAAYTPYMPTTGSVTVDVVKADGSAVEQLTKNYAAAGNIVQVMNDALAEGTVTGVEAVNMLRDYIDTAYNGYYGNNRADLFIGQNAAWDADELVALLRCVVANPQTLNGTDSVAGLFSREDANNQRRIDVFRFAGTLFGVRGLESRQDYLYIGTDGKLHDARQEEDTYVAIERMNAMVEEGLIATSFVNSEAVKSENMLADDKGFMHYDYNQTQTLYNETKLQDGEKYMAVMVPVARWYDGTEGGVYMRFTESWRSVKTDGWGISAAGVAGNNDKLFAALALIDFAYSQKGQILMSYGPDAFIKTKADGSYVTFNFNGTEMPVIADATYEELWDNNVGKGNYTNYARQYLGSTLSFVKSQAFEYQCTHAVGKEGAGKISVAIALGTIKHPELAITENPWYTSVPTVLPTTKAENDIIAGYTELASSGKFSQSKGQFNLLVDFICKGYNGEGTDTRANTVNTVKNTWGGSGYLTYKNDAWDRLVEYYESLEY